MVCKMVVIPYLKELVLCETCEKTHLPRWIFPTRNTSPEKLGQSRPEVFCTKSSGCFVPFCGYIWFYMSINILFRRPYYITDYRHCLALTSISMYVSTLVIHSSLLRSGCHPIIWHYKHVWETYSSNSIFITCPNNCIAC